MMKTFTLNLNFTDHSFVFWSRISRAGEAALGGIAVTAEVSACSDARSDLGKG